MYGFSFFLRPVENFLCYKYNGLNRKNVSGGVTLEKILDNDNAAVLEHLENEGNQMSAKENNTIKETELDWKAYFDNALSLDKKGCFDLALIDYTKAINSLKLVVDDTIDKNYEFAILYYSRGTCFSDTAKYQEALADLTKAIKLAPYYPAAYNNRGNVYKSLGDYNKAIADHTQSLALDNTDGHVYFNRGTSYMHEDMHAAALPDLLRGFKHSPIYGLKLFWPYILSLIGFVISLLFK